MNHKLFGIILHLSLLLSSIRGSSTSNNININNNNNNDNVVSSSIITITTHDISSNKRGISLTFHFDNKNNNNYNDNDLLLTTATTSSSSSRRHLRGGEEEIAKKRRRTREIERHLDEDNDDDDDEEEEEEEEYEVINNDEENNNNNEDEDEDEDEDNNKNEDEDEDEDEDNNNNNEDEDEDEDEDNNNNNDEVTEIIEFQKTSSPTIRHEPPTPAPTNLPTVTSSNAPSHSSEYPSASPSAPMIYTATIPPFSIKMTTKTIATDEYTFTELIMDSTKHYLTSHFATVLDTMLDSRSDKITDVTVLLEEDTSSGRRRTRGRQLMALQYGITLVGSVIYTSTSSSIDAKQAERVLRESFFLEEGLATYGSFLQAYLQAKDMHLVKLVIETDNGVVSTSKHNEEENELMQSESKDLIDWEEAHYGSLYDDDAFFDDATQKDGSYDPNSYDNWIMIPKSMILTVILAGACIGLLMALIHMFIKEQISNYKKAIYS